MSVRWAATAWLAALVGACESTPDAAATSDAAIASDAAPPPDAAAPLDVPPSADAAPTPLLTRLAYLADQDTDGVDELFVAVLTDGAVGPPTKVNAPLVAGGAVESFAWSPDGNRLAYQARHLYVVDMSGPTPGSPTRVNDALVEATSVADWAWSPTSRWLAYRAEQSPDVQTGLYVVDTTSATPGPPIRVNDALPADASVKGARWAPDGGRLAYRADQEIQGVNELFVADTSGAAPGVPVQVSADFTAGGNVAEGSFDSPWGYDFSPNSRRIAYRAASDLDYRDELYVVDLRDPEPGAPLEVSPELVRSVGVESAWWWSPDSAWIAFRVWERELWLASMLGAPAPILVAERITGAVWSPDSATLVYHGDPDGDGTDRLFALDMTDPALLSVPITPSLPAWSDVIATDVNYQGYFWKRDSSALLYLADQDSDALVELFVMPMSGASPGAVRKVNDSLASFGPVFADRGEPWSPDGAMLLYRATENVIGKPEVYASSLDAEPFRVSGPIVPGGGVADVWPDRLYRWAPNALQVAYMADGEIDERVELYVVSVGSAAAGTAARVNASLPDGGDVHAFAWSPSWEGP